MPTTPYASGAAYPVRRQGDWIWAPLRREWRRATPEEEVRQRIIHRLHTRYGYALDQMAQEKRQQSGRKSPKADVVVCRDAESLRENKNYVLVVETKNDVVMIDPADYDQGESYARAVGCEFLLMHNRKETRAFRLVPGAPGHRIDIEDVPRADDFNNPKRLEAIRRKTRAFSREDFRRLLFECHTILRDTHKMEPGQAFDQISKVLFVKMAIERSEDEERFSREYIEWYRQLRQFRGDEVMNDLFDDAKRLWRAEGLFSESDRLEISLETFRRIVEKLERFNLSSTSDDVKGLAFERFLGQTFRGELGQFFTPRPIVEFMVAMVDPQEGELCGDPASGTGGFLIQWVDTLRHKIETSVHREKEKARRRIAKRATKEGWDRDREEAELAAAIDPLNAQLDLSVPESRLSKVARSCFGADAEGRAARTSKMNMIMHGDGHAGIYHHDGLLDVGGMFEGRFDVVLTNPPFGATVGSDQRVGDTPQASPDDPGKQDEYAREFGAEYTAAQARLEAARRTRDPILDLFDIGRDPIGGARGTAATRKRRPTEMLFLERALNLLRPGGRMGIVLPEGILNNPSNQWLREYVERRARILAIVSIPQDVFASAKATVKTSLVFLQRLTEEDEQRWTDAWQQAEVELCDHYEERRRTLRRNLEPRIETYDDGSIAARMEELVALESSGMASRAAIREAKQQIRDLVTTAHRSRRRQLESELRNGLKKIDDEQAAAVRRRFKELVDYSIFFYEADAAGITATGATGADIPNDLPHALTAYRRFCADPNRYIHTEVVGDNQEAA